MVNCVYKQNGMGTVQKEAGWKEDLPRNAETQVMSQIEKIQDVTCKSYLYP